MSAYIRSPVKRFLPYAQEHDRLQLALLYLEHEESKLNSINGDLESLNKRQGQLEDCLPIMDEEIAKLRAQDNGESKERKDALLGWFTRESQKASEELELTKERINQHSTARDQVQELLSHRPTIQGLIEELYSSAFTGETPEFKHEDDVEAMAMAAEQVHAERARAHFASINPHLATVSCYLFLIHNIVTELHHFVRSSVSHGPQSLPNPDQTAQNELLEHHCKDFLGLYDTLLGEYEQYCNKQTDHSPPPINWVADPEKFLTTMRAAMLTPREQHAASVTLINISQEMHNFALWIKITGDTDSEKHHIREAVYEWSRNLRDVQLANLAETRREILDHVIDPTKCRLYSIMPEPPSYRRSGRSNYPPKGERIKQASQARLNRARNTTCSSELASEQHTFPGYSGTKDVEVIMHNCSKWIATNAGETTEEVGTREGEGNLTFGGDAGQVVYGTLDDMLARARKELFPALSCGSN
ncbi:hypothetical protein FRC08_001175 [Ceratobasidium sp. 394]|nr:hypothetical protein FRC08_001175 [Ceratobasidium sp. 394]